MMLIRQKIVVAVGLSTVVGTVSGCNSLFGSARMLRVSHVTPRGGVVARSGEAGLEESAEMMREVCGGPYRVTSEEESSEITGVDAVTSGNHTSATVRKSSEEIVTFVCR